ncbi:MAG: hypothetical protein P9M06_05850 [Candidatus Saelkia tenebricola]|nr:hypothetical protein [Candidatus Saelkia tenebricola]
MKTFTKILMILVCIAVYFQQPSVDQSACRRIKSLDREISPPPGVNTEALFRNIWTFLEIFDSPQVLAQAYPELSSLCFKSFSDRKMTKAEYNEVISHISNVSGIAVEEISGYEKYSDIYERTKARDMLTSFEQEFLSVLNKSGNMESVFRMVKSFCFAEYVATQTRHILNEEIPNRQQMLNLYSWILSGNENISKIGRSQNILLENKDFFIKNGEEIVAYSLVRLFYERQQMIDGMKMQLESLKDKELSKKQYNHDVKAIENRMKELQFVEMWYGLLISNICGKEFLQVHMQSVKTRIKNMAVDEKIKQKIFNYFPKYFP